ncbi:protein NLRC3-like [Cyprinodon tularosa]|uniref:protein NLRC3-like n=1 Tax=Cyprinodon tularosa TaxID=77115 RepID=UPI0018E23ADB|nr:protein NLRC3-like [Cyprinodon tularosa]
MTSAKQLLRSQKDLLLSWICEHPTPLLRWLCDDEVLSHTAYTSLLEKSSSEAVAQALETACASEESSQKFLEVLREVQDYYCKDLHLWVDKHCRSNPSILPQTEMVKDQDKHKKPKGPIAKLFRRKNKVFSITAGVKGKKDLKLIRTQIMANLKVPIASHKASLLKRMEELTCYSEGSREVSNSDSHIEIRYTDLFVTEDNDFTDSSQHEYFDLASRRARIYVHQSCQRIRPSQLLSPLETTGQPPKRVKVKGIAGIGKSVVVQKLVYEWAIGKSMREFICIFGLCFRELNLIEAPLSLLDLLGERFGNLKDALQDLFTAPKSLLFILDGLDEFKFFLNWNSRDTNIGIESKLPVAELIVALIKGNLLPEASIILTTRPSTEAPKHFFQRCCVVLGFEENQVKEYTTKFYKDREVSNKVYKYISNNDNIFVLSFIPLYCYIICIAMAEFFSGTQAVDDLESLELNPPKTVSEVYLCYLFTVVKHHALRGSAERSASRSKVLSLAKQQLTNLGKLAYENLLKRKIMFSEEDLESYGVKSDQIQGTFLCQILHPLKEERVRLFSFFHLTVQEHLGALYCALNLLSHEGITQALNLWCFGLHPPSTSSTLLKHMELDMEMLESLQMFTRFFMGLLRARLEKQLDGLVDSSTDEGNGIHTSLGLWFQAQFKHRKMKNETALNLLHCLMEFHMEKTTTIAAPEIKKLNLFKMKLSIVDCAAMHYVLKFSPHTLEELNLGYSNIGNRGLHRLRPILHRCETLYLRYNCLDWQAAILESAVLKSNECQVKKLFMCGNNLGPEGVNELWKALEHNTTVEELYLDITGITEKGTENIVNCLSKNTSLRILTIVGNDIGDLGRERLRELQKLRADLRIIANFVDDLGLLQAYLDWVEEIRADRDQMDSVKNVDALQSVLKGLQQVGGNMAKGQNANKAMELYTKTEELLNSHLIGWR